MAGRQMGWGNDDWGDNIQIQPRLYKVYCYNGIEDLTLKIKKKMILKINPSTGVKYGENEPLQTLKSFRQHKR